MLCRCLVLDCKHNQSELCKAENIEVHPVENKENSTCKGPSCKTFESKDQPAIEIDAPKTCMKCV